MNEFHRRNCITYWLPKLEAAGVPIPETEIIRVPGVWRDLYDLCDGKPPPFFAQLVEKVRHACNLKGYPAFLRTGQGSGKHNWKNCCYVQYAAMIPSHIRSLVEWSEMVDIIGLPYDVFAVREMLPVKPVAVLDRYGDMPLVEEFRFFIRDGKVVCVHHYWPHGAIMDGMGDDNPQLASSRQLYDDLSVFWHKYEAARMADTVARVFNGDGAWSVDLLWTDRGYYVIDMAEAERSFHFDGCPHAESFK